MTRQNTTLTRQNQKCLSGTGCVCYFLFLSFVSLVFLLPDAIEAQKTCSSVHEDLSDTFPTTCTVVDWKVEPTQGKPVLELFTNFQYSRDGINQTAWYLVEKQTYPFDGQDHITSAKAWLQEHWLLGQLTTCYPHSSSPEGLALPVDFENADSACSKAGKKWFDFSMTFGAGIFTCCCEVFMLLSLKENDKESKKEGESTNETEVTSEGVELQQEASGSPQPSAPILEGEGLVSDLVHRVLPEGFVTSDDSEPGAVV